MSYSPGAVELHEPQPISDQSVGLGDFHAVWGGTDPEGHLFRPRFVGVAEVRKNLLSVDGILSSLDAAGSTTPSQSAICQWGWGFHTVRGGIDPVNHRVRSRFVGGIGVWKDF